MQVTEICGAHQGGSQKQNIAWLVGKSMPDLLGKRVFSDIKNSFGTCAKHLVCIYTRWHDVGCHDIGDIA